MSSVAFGGHYTTGMTSGLVFTASPGGGTPTFGQGTASGTVGGGSGNVEISGAVSTTYSWVTDYPNEPPPTNVIAIETCNISSLANAYYGTNYSSPSATSDNGMGATWSTNTTRISTIWVGYAGGGVPIGMQATSSSNGSRARVLGGGATVIVSSSPKAKATSSSGSYSATISYSAKLYVPSITVGGTIQFNQETEILAGQGASGLFNSGAPDVTAKPNSSSWTVTGSTFSDFVVAPDLSTGEAFPVLPSTWQDDVPTWRWTTDGSSTVTCTCTLSYQTIGYPSGDIGAISATKIVKIMEVPSQLLISVFNPGQILTTGVPTLTSRPTGNGANAVEMLFKATTPPQFVMGGNSGTVALTQVLTNTTYKVNGVTQPKWSTNGPGNWLDGSYPYAALPLTNMPANGQDWGESVDSPYIYSGLATSLSMDLFAEDFTLHTPPGGEAVPLMHGEWHHNSSASLTGGVWTMPTNQTVRDLNGVKIPTHPKWIHKMN